MLWVDNEQLKLMQTSSAYMSASIQVSDPTCTTASGYMSASIPVHSPYVSDRLCLYVRFKSEAILLVQHDFSCLYVRPDSPYM